MISSPSQLHSTNARSGRSWIPETETYPWRVKARHTTIRAVSHALTYLDSPFGDQVREGFGVLMYHRCCNNPAGVEKPSINVTPGRFESQISGLMRRGFRVRSLPAVIADLEAGIPVARNTVVITFDDGFAGMHKHVLPVLQNLNVPASVFVCTAMLDTDFPMPFDHWGIEHADRVPEDCYRAMTTNECEELIESGLFDIGAHTHTHQDFRGRPSDFEADLQTNVDELKRRFGIERPTFAFPFGTPALGFADQTLADAAQRVGVRCAVTTGTKINRASTDRFALGRFNVFPWDTDSTLAARLHGWYEWLPAVSASVRRLTRLGHKPNPAPATVTDLSGTSG